MQRGVFYSQRKPQLSMNRKSKNDKPKGRLASINNFCCVVSSYDNSDDSAEEESAKPDLDLAKPIKPDLVLTNIKDLFSAEYFDKKNLEGILPKPFVETEKPPETTMAHFYPPGLGPPRPENGWPFCPTVLHLYNFSLKLFGLWYYSELWSAGGSSA